MTRRLLLIILVLLQCSIIVAQDYVYSVTTGTAWARDIYPKIERRERDQMKHVELLPGAPNFGQIFRQITYAYNKSNTYNDSIFYDLSHEKWIDMFKRRARRFADFYAEDNIAIDQIIDYFKKPGIPDAAYDSLYFYTRNMYFRNINDVFLYEKFVDIMVPHYEALEDTEHLIFCYMCAGLYNYQCSRMGDREASHVSEKYYQKVLNFGDSFAHFADPLNRYYYIAAYVNLAIMHTQAGNISVSESKNITHQVQDIFKKPESQEVFRQDSLLSAFSDWSYDLFRLRGITTFICHHTKNDKLRDELYASYLEIKSEIGNDFSNLKNRYYAKLQYDDYMIEAYMGHITWDEAYKRLSEELANDPEVKLDDNKTPLLKINYLNNLFQTVVYTLEHTSLSNEVKRESTKKMISRMLGIIERYEHSRYPFEKGLILANIARKTEILQYLTPDERKELLFRLIVLEQPTTYVHVTMVAELSKELAQAMIEQQPEFFMSLPNMSSTEDIVDNKDAILNFIYEAAIYHDLGKITMPTVVNNCIRKLNNHEFSILEMHPEKSRPFFSIDPSLKAYQDIALGHHKWYNGRGYPASIDNLKSPYFPIICLVTICDCLDAATENIGRNYHRPKPFEIVMQEFIKDSGTRYHPQIINFIRNNKEVQDKLKQIVSDGRFDHYYKLYARYMAN